MRQATIESTVLAAASYDHGLLEIQFRSGVAYRYFDVPLHVYQALLTAESKGRYFNAHIRNCSPSHQIHASELMQNPGMEKTK